METCWMMLNGKVLPDYERGVGEEEVDVLPSAGGGLRHTAATAGDDVICGGTEEYGNGTSYTCIYVYITT